ncbi:MAG: NUDIX hydrolase [Bacteroidales bacterium]|nr:NUDIX hydrolase [Bacteroidales bacterium]
MGKNFRYAPGSEFPWQYKYEHMAVTTDCVIFAYEDRTLKVLLVRRGLEPYKGDWAFPGGFLKTSETAREGALRELKEETTLETSAIRELGVFSDVDRDPRERVITIAYYALIKPSEVVGGDDAEEARWFPVSELPTLAFDHRKIFEAAMERLRRDIHFEPVGFDLLDEEFTIPDLQRLYEIILGTKFDRRNFQRKVLASGILEEVPRDEAEPMPICCEAMPRMKMADVEYCAYVPEPIADSAKPKRRPGRIASLFRLNRAKYAAMKEEGDKLEF